MLAAFEKLSKILDLEQNTGYENKSVIGGIEALVENWRKEALEDLPEDSITPQVEAIADQLAHYPTADLAERRQMLEDIQRQLRQTPDMPAPAPAPRKPTPRKPVPPSTPLAAPPAAPTPTSVSVPDKAERPGTGLDAPVSALPGISTVNAAKLQRLGITTIRDFLHHYPHRYDDYSQLKPINQLEYGEQTTIIGTVWETNSKKTRDGGAIVSSIIADASGTIEASWFNQPYLTRQLRPGRRIVISGKVDEYLGRLRFQSPVWEPLEKELIHTGRLVPIYPLTRGITSRTIRRYMKRMLDHWAPRLPEPLPESMRERLGLMGLSTSMKQIHFPDDLEASEEARHRLSFEEFLLIQLGMLRQRQQWRSEQGIPLAHNPQILDSFLASLPFKLTDAQSHSLDQILADIAQPLPMSRLIQGDVGSGKTVVATAAILMALAAGKQAAIMAPTEILAEQHFRTIQTLLASATDWGLERPVSLSLLTGSLRRVERREVYTAMASGATDIVVGTHALIQKHVTFKDLGLVIVDEQHRFGVAQRAALRGKGGTPHMLVMSATPIPRSLALTLYGDLDISVIDELPPGRKPIQTRWLLTRERERAYAFLRGQIERGRQAFILYPLIEGSDKVQAKAAVEEYERLSQTIFPDLRLGLLHGRLKGKEKEAIMEQFNLGELDILVSTSVIEVGIDVPNATVMMIEGADRFGLAQLHQFRGRVGRGEHQSYCLLISDTASPDDPNTKATWERLKAIEDSQDGFILAEKDLELRGPGDFFGVRQSGLPPLHLASLSNVQTLELARTEAQTIFQDDPELARPEHRLLADQLERFWHGQGDPS